MNYSNNALTESDLALCEQQADLFAMAAKDDEVYPAYFIRRFMNSSFANMFDNKTLLNSFLSIDDIYNAIKENLQAKDNKSLSHSEKVLMWIGYIYRYWSILKGMKSKQVYKIAKTDRMISLYPTYHSQDPKKVVDSIMASSKIDVEMEFDEFYRSWQKNRQ